VATGIPHLKIRWTTERYQLGQTGMVYYLERSDGPIKIGYTHNYPQRRDTLVQRYGSLLLIGWEVGASAIEAERHEKFAHLRLKPIAEWFAPGEDLIDHVLMLRAML